jgi:hypothetical protein
VAGNIIIPQKIYVGVNKRASSEFPSANLTAWGTDTAAKGRMTTVDTYSDSAVTIDNTACVGFEVSGYAFRDEVVILDPRGFSAHIKASVFFDLLGDCTIVKGKIVEPLVWARSQGNNVLLSTHSDNYLSAVIMTEIANSKASWRDVELGYEITLTNGLRGIYLGRVHSLTFRHSMYVDSHNPNENRLIVDHSSSYAILQQFEPGQNRNFDTRLHLNHTARLAKVVPRDKMDAQTAEHYLNQLLEDSRCHIPFEFNQQLVCVCNHASDFTSVEIEFSPIEYTSIQDARKDHRLLAGRLPDQRWGIVTGLPSAHEVMTVPLDAEALEQNKWVYCYEVKRSHWAQLSYQTNLDSDVGPLHSVSVSVKTRAGNHIKKMI